MDTGSLADFGLLLMFFSVITFIIAFFVVVSSKTLRKKALITMVICAILCIIGFGICAENISLGPMH